jgi:hypothetical protein
MLAESKKQLGQVSLFLNIDMHMHIDHLITHVSKKIFPTPVVF